MYYIDAHALFRRREKVLFQFVPALVVFLAFLGITILSSNTAKNIYVQEYQKILEQKNTETTTSLQQRMNAYEDILRGGVGLFNASDVVTRQEWRQYLASYNISERYPGVQGVGYIELVNAEQLPSHIARVRNDNLATYAIFPEVDRSLYAPIVYLEPTNEKNIKAIGFDMLSEASRQNAMEKARDSGSASISNIVTLIQDRDEPDKQPGFLMYVPLYVKNSKPKSIQEKRAAITGFIYAPFRSYDLISQLQTAQDQQYGFKIETNTDTKMAVYETDNFSELSTNSKNRAETAELTLQGITWKITGYVMPEVVNESVRSRPTSVLWGGVLFSFFVAGFIYLLLVNRSRVLADKESTSVQFAKDELLALASHQLRTPATGVKQYIGMLREGFVGSFTPTQQKLLDKAYASNERQLGTINEMLFVARADADQLQMSFSHFDFKQLVEDVVDEQVGQMAKKKLRHNLLVPKKSLPVRGDKEYLRMAVENVLSNAVKYTKDGGSIRIKITATQESVTLHITDTGVGVSKADHHLLFQKFSRIPNELTSQVSGTGIGLYLVKQVVDAHGGKIAFDSAPSKGSTVTMRLPILIKA